ncbi:MAG: (Fe-S)-binding protein [Deltaproteobacteria bacterium]|nr:(Fe-S)-binding protein [Deltaproteobacteria bacterium]MCB9788742.1 (Fe-S)-binding protein [Deltaproteobacteria bacterium]
MSRLSPLHDALTLCTFCPSLCHHACPVAAVEGRDTVTPWGLVSLVHHIETGSVRLTDDVAHTLYRCSGCRACTEACLHGQDVEGILFTARAEAVARGRRPHARERFQHDQAPRDPWWETGPARFHPDPTVLLLPGHRDLVSDATAVRKTLRLCERLDEAELACADASLLDVGYDLWAAGYRDEFALRAERLRQAVGDAAVVVVMSAEALYALKVIYPQVNQALAAQVLHVSDFLLPLLSGAVVSRVGGAVGYHDSCHLARHFGVFDVPRELLRRVLERPPIELRQREADTFCCGGTGCLGITAPQTAAAMSEEVVQMALEAGCERLVTFAPECVGGLRAAAGERLRVDGAITLIDEAVAGDEA